MGNFFSSSQKDFSTGGDLQERLSKSVENLFYLSETDAGFEVLLIDDPEVHYEADSFRIHFGIDPGARAEERSFDELFDRLTRTYEGSNETAIKRAKRFAELRDLMAGELSDLKIFRFGEIRIDIFIIGRDKTGRIVGLRTFAIET